MTVAEGARSTVGASWAAALLHDACVENLSYAVLRGRPVVDDSGDDPGRGGITVLVAPSHLGDFEHLARRHHLNPLPSVAGDLAFSPNGGSDPGSTSVLTLTSTLGYGARGRWLATGTEEARVLRRAEVVRGIRVASLADQLVDAVLHCVLDLGDFPMEERSRLRDLMRSLRDAPTVAGRAAERVQQELAPALTWSRLLAAIVEEHWDALLATRSALRRHLIRRAPAASVWRLASGLLSGWTKRVRVVSGRAPSDVEPEPPSNGASAGASPGHGSDDGSSDDSKDGSKQVTDKQLRGSSLLLAGRGFSTGLKFLAELIVVRYLATSEYGSWTYALSAIVFLRGLSTLGLNRAVTRFVPIHLERGEYRELAGVVTFVLGCLLLSGAFVVTAFYAFPDQVASVAGVSEQQPIDLLFVLILLVPIETTDDFLTGICAAFADSKTIFVRRYLLNPSLRLAIALTLVLMEANVRWLAYGYLFAGLAGVVYYTWSVYGEIRRRGLLDPGYVRGLRLPVRRVLSYTVPVMGADWCGILMMTTGPLLLGYFTEMSEVALFQVVIPLVTMNRLVSQSFGVLFEPSAARLLGRDDRRGLDLLYWRSAVWVAVLSFPAFAVSFTASDPLTTLLYGERYAAAAPILSVLAVGFFLDAALGFNSATLRVTGQVKSLLGVNVVAAVVNVILNLILIPRMGALGAGIATGMAWVLYGVLKQIALYVSAGVRRFEAELVGPYAVIALASLALVLTRVQWPGNEWVVGSAAVAASLAVMARARATLSITSTFPELGRYPIVRKLVG